MPTDNPLLSYIPTYDPCNAVVNLQPFVTERVIHLHSVHQHKLGSWT